ncbi:unnamed protein product [Orchesella dallaii]|uniref:Uncharacterized protein n=1 Tax=Orchesella dallaii TaxID=48710 RepID=A0ABP1RXC5_9HEXA
MGIAKLVCQESTVPWTSILIKFKMNFPRHGDGDNPWSWSRGGRAHNSNNSYRHRSRSPIQKVLRDRVEEEKPPPVRNFGDYDPVRWSRRHSAPAQPQWLPRQNQEERQYHNNPWPSEFPTNSTQNNQYYDSNPEQNYNPFDSSSNSQPLLWEVQFQETLLTSDDLVTLEPGRYELLFRELVKSKNLSCNLKRLPDFQAGNGATFYSYSMDFWPFRNLTMKETINGQRNTDKLAARENLFSAALWKLESLMPGTYAGGSEESEPQPVMPSQSSSSSRVVYQNSNEGEEPQFKIAIPRGPSIAEVGNRQKNYKHINKKRRN